MFSEDQREKTIQTHVQKEIGLHSIVNTTGGPMYSSWVSTNLDFR